MECIVIPDDKLKMLNKLVGRGVITKHNKYGWEEEGRSKIKLDSGAYYEGGISNYKAHGKGKLTSEYIIYEGNWEYGVPEGEGIIIYDSIKIEGEWNTGNLNLNKKIYFHYLYSYSYSNSGYKYYYNGIYSNNKAEGYGSLYKINSNTNIIRLYDGEWKQGYREGEGTEYNIEGQRIYEGEWKQGKREGKGKEYDIEGEIIYDGEWKHGYREGKGKEYNIKGQIIYDGEWKQGKREGKGKEYNIEGQIIYEGEWKQGKREGKGKEYNIYGEIIYEGEWKQGNRGKGKGIILNSDGSKAYEGYINGTNKEGKGIEYKNDGSEYKGFWISDKRSGCGLFTWPSGLVEEREYEEGRMIRAVKINPLVIIEQRKLKDSENLKIELDKANKELQEVRCQLLEMSNKLIQTEKLVSEADIKLTCQICMEAPRNAVVMPCMHYIYCNKCIETSGRKKCPTCNTPISGVLKCNLEQ